MSKQKLIDDLNEDLAYEYTAIIQYLTYAAAVSGPARPELRAFFEAEIPDETGHAQFLAGKIVALGGEPTTTPKPVARATTAKQMLEAILKAETDAHDRYAKRAAHAEELGMKGLQVQLETIIADESGHFEETERILREWPV